MQRREYIKDSRENTEAIGEIVIYTRGAEKWEYELE